MLYEGGGEAKWDDFCSIFSFKENDTLDFILKNIRNKRKVMREKKIGGREQGVNDTIKENFCCLIMPNYLIGRHLYKGKIKKLIWKWA
jgi:hypothetical protein